MLAQSSTTPDPATTPAVNDPTTPPPPTATDMPNTNVGLPRYRPNAQDFLTNLDSIPSNSLSLRRTEPTICERLRAYLNFKLKLFHERLMMDIKRFAATFVTSRSNRLTEAIADARMATTQAIDDYAARAQQYMTIINQNCAQLNSVETLQNINRLIEDLRARQLTTAGQLAAIPQAYEEKMQSFYRPVEQIIGNN